jgi:uncharacterized protein YbjT (DUF2867 family)
VAGGLIGVTGATGQVGGQVARALAADRIPQRLIVRDAGRAPRLPVASVAEIDGYGDSPTPRATHERPVIRAALEWIDVLFMVSATESADRLAQHRTFIDAAADAGVRHIVYTSFLGAAPDATFTLARDHFATEEHIKASGMAWTFLRDSFYLDLLPAYAGADGVIRGPAGDGVVGAVARADVAGSAAAVLRQPAEHAGRTYELTGREALNLTDVARTITEVTGRAASYHAETVEEAYASRASYNAPDWEVDAWVSTYTAIANGELAKLTGDVRALTGREPLTLREVLEAQQG